MNNRIIALATALFLCVVMALSQNWLRDSSIPETERAAIAVAQAYALPQASTTATETVTAAPTQTATATGTSTEVATPTPTATTALTATPTATPALNNVEVQFTQLHWLADDGSVRFAYSRVGVAEFSFPRDANRLLDVNGGGFVNLVTDLGDGSGPQWSVRNLYLSYRTRRELRQARPSVQFGLPLANGTQVSHLMFMVSLTRQRLANMPNTMPRQAMVLARDYLVGGVEQGGSGNAEMPLTLGDWIGCANLNRCAPNTTTMGRVLVANKKIAAIDEAKMGCAPAAAARSIKYLKGDAVGDAQSIYSDLATYMGTSPTTGTTKENILSGKRKYTKDKKLKILTNLVPWSKSQIKLLMDELNKGADVEIIIKWDNQDIGHVAMVTSITQIGKNQWQVKYVDDPTQGDGKAENQEHVITVNGDGSFAGGKITHFLVETKQT